MKKGISLIVLVITIIVLIILAGVAISTIINSNMVGKAQDATEASVISNEKEMIMIAYNEARLDKATNKDLGEVTGPELAACLPQGKATVTSNSPLTVKITETEREYEIINGNIILKGEAGPETIDDSWVIGWAYMDDYDDWSFPYSREFDVARTYYPDPYEGYILDSEDDIYNANFKAFLYEIDNGKYRMVFYGNGILNRGQSPGAINDGPFSGFYMRDIEGYPVLDVDNSSEPHFYADYLNNIDIVEVKSGITRIDDSMFSEMKFRVAYIPSSVESIGWYAFQECRNLEEIYFDSNFHGTFDKDPEDPRCFAFYYTGLGEWLSQTGRANVYVDGWEQVAEWNINGTDWKFILDYYD